MSQSTELFAPRAPSTTRAPDGHEAGKSRVRVEEGPFSTAVGSYRTIALHSAETGPIASCSYHSSSCSHGAMPVVREDALSTRDGRLLARSFVGLATTASQEVHDKNFCQPRYHSAAAGKLVRVGDGRRAYVARTSCGANGRERRKDWYASKITLTRVSLLVNF